ncbi:MAG: hypothetical protein SNJ74_07235 [Fimbriimonadaceae bacterium]
MARRWSIVAAVVIFETGSAAMDLGRAYQVGETDRFGVAVQIETDVGSVDLTMRQVQVVRRLLADGQAEVESRTEDLEARMNGEKIPVEGASQMPPVNLVVDRWGWQMRAPAVGRGSGASVAFLRYALVLPRNPLEIGKSVPVEADLPIGSRVRGTAKLEEVESGVARILQALEITARGQTRPQTLTMTTWVETKTSRILRVEGQASASLGADGDAGAVRGMQFRFERLP